MTPQRHRIALAGAFVAILAAGCIDENTPRLYRTHDVPPAGLVTDVPPSMYDQVDEGVQKIEITEADIAALKHLGPSLVEAKDGAFRGVNFAVYSRRAEKMRLLLFDDPESALPTRQIDMKQIGDVWNVFVEGVGLGQHYGYVAWGPNWRFDESWYPGSVHGFSADVDTEGNRFNPNKLLFDPYCKAFNRDHDWSKGSAGTGPNRASLTWGAAMKCVVVKSRHEWSDTEKEWRANRQSEDFDGHRWNDLILYEVHAKGFTANPSSGVRHPGTFRGFGEKAAYLKDLGVTAVELMPPYEKPLDAGYWGYNTLSFFAPELSYASRRERHEVIDEFKWMVEQLHANGIEVIVDVVYNHTGEGGLWREKIFRNATGGEVWNLDPEETASLFSYRGLDNWSYYVLDNNNRAYANYTGVGNTVRCNNAPGRRLILDSLRYWVEELHVDGFRFDLAPVLGAKDMTSGQPWNWDPANSSLQDIIEDPVLQKYNTRIIAEPWGGDFKLGGFNNSTSRPGYAWGEWNGHFRDWWRSFVNSKGEYEQGGETVDADWKLNGKVGNDDGGAVITGSKSLFDWNGRKPYHSMNFVTVHDGMTMYDVVSYGKKVNDCSPLNPVCCTNPFSSYCEESKKSGENNNRSRNWSAGGTCGSITCTFGSACIEGGCVNAEEVKRQLMRDFFVAMMISHGTPLLFGGDEWMRSQLGNNNTYTPEADNPYSWHDWGSWEASDERYRMFDFVRNVTRFRKEFAHHLAPAEYGTFKDEYWRNPDGSQKVNEAWNSRSVMIHYSDRSKGPELAILINMEDGPVKFQLPPNRQWKRLIDTQRYFDTNAYLSEKKLPPRASGNIALDKPDPVGADYEARSRTIVVMKAD